MIRRRLTTTVLVSLFILNSLGLSLWVHLHGHDTQFHPTNNCVICQLLTTARQEKGIIETSVFYTDDNLFVTLIPDSPAIILHPAVVSLYRRGPPLCT